MTTLEYYKLQNITKLPVNPYIIAKQNGYHLHTYQEYMEITGEKFISIVNTFGQYAFTQLIDNEYYIFYNDHNNESKTCWALMCQLCHIASGHITKECPMLLKSSKKFDYLNVITDNLTANILCPQIVLHFCSVDSWQELMAITNLTIDASMIMYQQLLQRRIKGEFFNNKEDLQLIEHFSKFISNYITSKSILKNSGNLKNNFLNNKKTQ